MKEFRNFSLLLALLLILILSGCGIGRPFHNGYHNRYNNYGSTDGFYDQKDVRYQKYSNYNWGFYRR